MRISDLKVSDFVVNERVTVYWGGGTSAPKTAEGLHWATVKSLAGGWLAIQFDDEAYWRYTEPAFVRKLTALDELAGVLDG